MSPDRDYWLDRARGLTVLAMIAYHFCFDLIHFGYPFFTGHARDMNHHMGWITVRSLIVSSFIFISGVVFGRKSPQQHPWHNPNTWKLGLSALLVSIGSYAVFPQTWIDFGVLHFFFVTRLLLPILKRLSPLALAVSALSLALLTPLQNPFFDTIPWRWIGFTTHKPLTEDYVPLLPWLAVFLLGLLLSRHISLRHYPSSNPKLINKIACWIGRHSLIIYLIHQPLLWGIFTLAGHYDFQSHFI